MSKTDEEWEEESRRDRHRSERTMTALALMCAHVIGGAGSRSNAEVASVAVTAADSLLKRLAETEVTP